MERGSRQAQNTNEQPGSINTQEFSTAAVQLLPLVCLLELFSRSKLVLHNIINPILLLNGGQKLQLFNVKCCLNTIIKIHFFYLKTHLFPWESHTFTCDTCVSHNSHDFLKSHIVLGFFFKQTILWIWMKNSPNKSNGKSKKLPVHMDNSVFLQYIYCYI